MLDCRIVSGIVISMRSPVTEVARRDCGSFTSMPRWNIGAATMKMISSTSITSTSGTTLISASDVITCRPRPVRADSLLTAGPSFMT